MRRREHEGPPPPPVELTDYQQWCADRGVPPFGDLDDRPSLRAAVARHRAWGDERAAWCARRGLDEWEVLGPRGPAPYDGMHGGLWSRPQGEDKLRCAEHGWTEDEHPG